MVGLLSWCPAWNHVASSGQWAAVCGRTLCYSLFRRLIPMGGTSLHHCDQQCLTLWGLLQPDWGGRQLWQSGAAYWVSPRTLLGGFYFYSCTILFTLEIVLMFSFQLVFLFMATNWEMRKQKWKVNHDFCIKRGYASSRIVLLKRAIPLYRTEAEIAPICLSSWSLGVTCS